MNKRRLSTSIIFAALLKAQWRNQLAILENHPPPQRQTLTRHAIPILIQTVHISTALTLTPIKTCLRLAVRGEVGAVVQVARAGAGGRLPSGRRGEDGNGPRQHRRDGGNHNQRRQRFACSQRQAERRLQRRGLGIARRGRVDAIPQRRKGLAVGLRRERGVDEQRVLAVAGVAGGGRVVEGGVASAKNAG